MTNNCCRVKDLLIESYEQRLDRQAKQLNLHNQVADKLEAFAAALEKENLDLKDQLNKLEKVVDRFQLRNAELADRIEALTARDQEDLLLELGMPH